MTHSTPAAASEASCGGVSSGATDTRAHFTVERVDGRLSLTRLRSSSLLKLLCLSQHDTPGVPVIYTSSYGGGLVAGDHVELDVALGEDSVAVLTTQASTKVYHRRDGEGARQTLRASVASGGLFVVTPDPVACFADARYDQHQTFDLTSGGSLVLLDWFTCGRLAHGERWAFDRYASRNVIRVGGRTIVNDGLLLDRADGPVDALHRAGACHCLATVYLVGPRLHAAADAIAQHVQALPLKRGDDELVSASRFNWGMVLRVGGDSAERVGRTIAERLAFLERELGFLPWQRKW